MTRVRDEHDSDDRTLSIEEKPRSDQEKSAEIHLVLLNSKQQETEAGNDQE